MTFRYCIRVRAVSMAWKMTNVQLQKGDVLAPKGVVRSFSADMGARMAKGCIWQ